MTVTRNKAENLATVNESKASLGQSKKDVTQYASDDVEEFVRLLKKSPLREPMLKWRHNF